MAVPPIEILSNFAYIHRMLWRNSRGRPLNAPAAFIHPCQPIVAKQPPTGPGWAHELKHDGYRLQIHVRDGRVRLFTMNGADWSKRYPRIVEEAARIKGSAVMDAEVVCLVKKGMPDFDTLHSRTADHLAVACAFDLLMRDGDDLRRQPLRERKLDRYSMTSSAAISKPGGTVKPSAFAVLRLTTVSNFVGVCTGRSAGFAPRRMRST
jgi:hypothetical protein